MQLLPFVAGPAYAIPFWSAYTLWIALETATSLRKRSRDKSAWRDRGCFGLIIGLLWTGISLDFALSSLAPTAAIRWERILLFYAGVALILVGLAFRFYAMSFLGRFFTYRVAVQTDQTVIERGPYKYIRHPSYTGALITLLGFALLLGNWVGLIALLGLMGIAYAYRISVEEAALVAALGDPYRQYMRRTRRIVPFLF